MAPAMLALAGEGPYDLVNCIRRAVEEAAYRSGHKLGNVLLTGMVRQIFGDRVHDMLSGYKLPSRRFVKIWTTEPKRFIINPIHQMPGLNI